MQHFSINLISFKIHPKLIICVYNLCTREELIGSLRLRRAYSNNVITCKKSDSVCPWGWYCGQCSAARCPLPSCPGCVYRSTGASCQAAESGTPQSWWEPGPRSSFQKILCLSILCQQLWGQKIRNILGQKIRNILFLLFTNSKFLFHFSE